MRAAATLDPLRSRRLRLERTLHDTSAYDVIVEQISIEKVMPTKEVLADPEILARQDLRERVGITGRPFVAPNRRSDHAQPLSPAG